MRKRRSKVKGYHTRQSLARRKPFLAPRARVLIVCEGGKTEPIYFKALRKDRRLTATEVEVHGAGCDPSALIQFAVDHIDKKKNEEGQVNKNPYDRVWCVFDCDAHERLAEAINRAKDLGFKIAFSNPCFELWYILHFDYSSAPCTSKQAVSLLRKKHIPEYTKAKNVYEHLLKLQDTAIQNAQSLRRHHETSSPARRVGLIVRNPSTSVDRLVAYLNGLG
ncbi:MAG: RloB domain-containing protein [Armatimonadetes bacterium]|nr:RloB domain-containing protein [Armatimonadota bacterium]NIM23551.1 RloB domain-containing protein [Armatimonadota bacterium]NIM67417.1 RloB domain-containing protein [Armatimonadota bacterium]NIM75918.1 RloB domain-containing protein [Armatimonadota bacterium]NIN05603.1 RloB domain-containing protein [Armatimonadota bacterium]